MNSFLVLCLTAFLLVLPWQGDAKLSSIKRSYELERVKRGGGCLGLGRLCNGGCDCCSKNCVRYCAPSLAVCATHSIKCTNLSAIGTKCTLHNECCTGQCWGICKKK